MTSVNSQVVFITGGGQGIGAEVARRLHAKGAKLVLTDLDEVALAARSAELGGDERVLTVVADVRDLAAMQAAAGQAVDKFGGIDVVVANAGIGSYGSVLKVDPEAVKRVLDVNLLGVFHTVRATLPSVIDRRGYVLIVSSLAAFTAAAGNGALRHVQGRQRASRSRAATRGRAPRRRRRLGTHVLDRYRHGPRHPGRPAHIPRAIGEVPVAVEQDHLGGQVRRGLRRRHRGTQETRVLPELGGCVPLAEAVVCLPGLANVRSSRVPATSCPAWTPKSPHSGVPPAPIPKQLEKS